MSIGKTKTRHTNESILATFVLDFKGIFAITDFFRKPLKPLSFRVAAICWVIFVGFSLAVGVPLYGLIIDMVNSLITWVPGVLGFTIGGYSFLIGFIQSNLMQKISEPGAKSVYSLFQLASASFACNILLQAFALMIAFVVHYIIYIDVNRKIKWTLPSPVIAGVNLLAFLLVSLSFAIAIAVIVQLVVNVFNFSQLHHYNTNKEKIDQMEEEQKRKNISEDPAE